MNIHRLAPPLLAIALVATAFAQDPADDKPTRVPARGSVVVGGAVPTLSRRPPDVLLLARPSIQQELKLTDAQRRTIARVDRVRRGRSVVFAEVAERGTLETIYSPIDEAAIAQFAEAQEASEAEIDAGLAGILDPRQRARLAQIGLQLEGPAAFDREDVRRALDLDDDQDVAIRVLLDEARRDLIRSSQVRVDVAPPMSARRRGAGPDLGADSEFQQGLARIRLAGDRVREDAARKIVRVLRRGQVERLDRLRGEPFDAAGIVAGTPADRPEALPRGGLRDRRVSDPDAE